MDPPNVPAMLLEETQERFTLNLRWRTEFARHCIMFWMVYPSCIFCIRFLGYDLSSTDAIYGSVSGILFCLLFCYYKDQAVSLMDLCVRWRIPKWALLILGATMTVFGFYFGAHLAVKYGPKMLLIGSFFIGIAGVFLIFYTIIPFSSTDELQLSQVMDMRNGRYNIDGLDDFDDSESSPDTEESMLPFEYDEIMDNNPQQNEQ